MSDNLRRATFRVGQAGLNGTGITAGEKTSITSDLAILKAAKYITQSPNFTLANEQSLSDLTTGLVKVTSAAGTGVLSTAVAADLPAHTHTTAGNINILIDGGGATITTGVKFDLRIPFAITLTAWNAFANQAGAIQIDLWRDTYANFPPTDADSITGSTPIVIPATNDKWGVTPLAGGMAGWDLSLDAEDIIRVNVDSVTSIQRVTIVLAYTRSL